MEVIASPSLFRMAILHRCLIKTNNEPAELISLLWSMSECDLDAIGVPNSEVLDESEFSFQFNLFNLLTERNLSDFFRKLDQYLSMDVRFEDLERITSDHRLKICFNKNKLLKISLFVDPTVKVVLVKKRLSGQLIISLTEFIYTVLDKKMKGLLFTNSRKLILSRNAFRNKLDAFNYTLGVEFLKQNPLGKSVFDANSCWYIAEFNRSFSDYIQQHTINVGRSSNLGFIADEVRTLKIEEGLNLDTYKPHYCLNDCPDRYEEVEFLIQELNNFAKMKI